MGRSLLGEMIFIRIFLHVVTQNSYESYGKWKIFLRFVLFRLFSLPRSICSHSLFFIFYFFRRVPCSGILGSTHYRYF
ncbi:hypothetical protein EMIT051CA3_70311 [Pseudomonas chlororaphis]